MWDSDTHLKTPEERKLLRKLDWSILTIGCIGFFVSASCSDTIVPLSNSRIAQIPRPVESGKRLCEVRTSFKMPKSSKSNKINTLWQWNARRSVHVWQPVHLRRKFRTLHNPIRFWFSSAEMELLRQGDCIYLRLRRHANPKHFDHPARPPKLLARHDGNWMGRLHFCSSGHEQLPPALCVSIPGRLLRELLVSMYVVCDGKLVHKDGTRYVVPFDRSPWGITDSWANDEDSAKRIALFHMASPVGSAASGYLVRTKIITPKNQVRPLNSHALTELSFSKQQCTTALMVFTAWRAGDGST